MHDAERKCFGVPPLQKKTVSHDGPVFDPKPRMHACMRAHTKIGIPVSRPEFVEMLLIFEPPAGEIACITKLTLFAWTRARHDLTLCSLSSTPLYASI